MIAPLALADECICGNGSSAQREACEECKVCRQVFQGGCPGPCNDRWRRKQCQHQQDLRDYDPLDQHQSRPEPPDTSCITGNPWCADCSPLIREQLGELDYLGALRVLRELGGDGYGTDSAPERVSGSADPASPSPSSDDVDDTATMLAGWEQAYRDLMGWPAAIRHGSLAAKRTECIAWLAERFSDIITSGIAADFGAEVMIWHAELKAKSKAGVRTLRKPLRCPSCKRLMMMYTDGDKSVRCYNPTCRRILSLPEYEAEVETLAARLKAAKITREDVQHEEGARV